MARMLGDAYVVISPDSRGFRAKADAQIKAALSGLKYTVPLGVDTEGTLNAIRSLQQRMRQMGLADFLDVNIPVGRLITQIQIIRRLLNQAGVADILEVDLDKASLARAQAQIGKLSQRVPVNFDVSKIPRLGPVQALSERLPVFFDISSLTATLGEAQEIAKHDAIIVPVKWDVRRLVLPTAGPSENIGVSVSGITSATAALEGLAAAAAMAADKDKVLAAQEALLSGPMMKNALIAMTSRDNLMARTLAMAQADAVNKTFSGDLLKQAAAQQAANLAAGDAVIDAARLRNTIADVTASVKAHNKYLADAIPLWKATGGWFGFATGKVQLFGGALTGIGIPAIIGAASAAHILIDAAIEIAAVIIPAGIALVAFGAMAAPTLNDIQKKMQAVWTTSIALNQAIYPLTNNMKNLESAVKPQVIQLFGEALVVAGKNTGLFTTVAQQAGNALDTLGARAAVALTSGGMAQFIREGPKDLAMIGDIIANIFGTIGNILRVIPGYAQQIFGALDGLTRGLEAVTGSGFGQEVLKWGLAVHGAILWMGLGATAAVFLGNALLSLAAKFGLVAAGLTVFNAAQFGAGIKAMISGIGILAGEMVTLGAGEDIAAAGALTLEGAWAAITAISPIVWIGAAIGGLIALVLWLGRSRSATQSYNDAVNASIAGAPGLQVATDITNRMADTLGNLRAAQDQLNHTQEFALQNIKGSPDPIRVVTQAYKDQLAVISGYKGELAILQGYQANYNQALKAAGGNTSFLTGTSISLNDAITKGGQTLKEYLIEVQANADAQQALALGTGRAAAAQNAQTNIFITETLPAMQKVTQAEDNIVSLLLSGEQAFTSFDQSLIQYSTDLGVSADKVLGLNTAQVTQASDLYSSVLPAFQKTIDAAQQMGVSTGDLTTIVATGAGQILTLAGNNKTAQATMVAMINNALGPGAVSMKDLNKWVAQNSTSQQGLNALWSKATVAASTLAGVLQSDLNAQFAQALLKSSGADQAITNLTDAITHGGTQTQAYRSARQQLINDLIATGLSATDAKNYVNNLQTQINTLHGKSVTVGVNATGSGQVVITGSGSASIVGAGTIRLVGARGMKINQGTGPTADDVPILVSKGETVVSAADSKKLSGLFSAMGVPGYAFGGLIGFQNATSSLLSSDTGKLLQAETQKVVNADIAKTRAAQQAAASAAVGGGQGAVNFAIIPSGGALIMPSPATAQEWAHAQLGSGIYGWGLGQWPPLVSLWNQESGWRWNATNPGSGAYGIPQSLPADKMAAAGADWLTDAATQMRWGFAYIRAAYGAPSGAWAHEVAHNWYKYGGKVMDKGGWLAPGWNPPMINNTGRPEPVGMPAVNVTLEVASAGSGTFDSMMTQWLKNNVRVKGGGSVQRAWGRAH